MRRLSHLTLASLVAFSLLSLLPASPVYAGGIIVNSLADRFTPGNSQCTLREAIINANTNIDSTRGDCAPGAYGNDLIAFSVHGTIILHETLPVLTDHITVIAPSNGVGITLNGNDRVGVFAIDSNINVSLQNLTIANGFATGGGAINNKNGFVSIINTSLINNTVSQVGGAIFNNSGMITISNSTFDNNEAFVSGGGIYNLTGVITISNSTFSDNAASFTGGGIYNFGGNVTILNNTIHGSSSSFGGSGIHTEGGIITVKNTIIANSVGKNCSGAFSASSTTNLDTDGSCGARFTTTSYLRLATLAYNGGRTQTFALKMGSDGINSGDLLTCASDFVGNLDQRGAARVHNCDIGAYESPYATVGVSLTTPATTVNAGEEVRLIAQLFSKAGSPSGTVTFKEGTATLGVVDVGTGRQALLILSSLSVGEHHVTATYNGDADFNMSVAKELVIIVEQ